MTATSWLSGMAALMAQLTDAKSGALATKRYLIIDRDAKYSRRLRKVMEEARTE